MARADEWVYGIHAVQHLLDSDVSRILDLRILDECPEGRLQALITRAERDGVAVLRVPRKSFDRLLDSSQHQGVAARCRPAARITENWLEEMLDTLETDPLLLVLDGVQDPHNLGACLRSADAAGVHAVIVPQDRAVGLTPVVRKVACGGAESVPLVQVTNLARTLRVLQERGIWLVGLAGEATQTLYETDLSGPLALILGAEEKGLRHLTREHCDLLVNIPMAGQVESLNVSVAAGVSLFEAVRQRSDTE